jgi:hypothetical protein
MTVPFDSHSVVVAGAVVEVDEVEESASGGDPQAATKATRTASSRR